VGESQREGDDMAQNLSKFVPNTVEWEVEGARLLPHA